MSYLSLTTKSIPTSVLWITLAAMPTAALSKRGIPFQNAAATLPNFENTKVSWCYNWDSSTYGASTGNLDYIPMLHSISSYYTSVWDANAQNAINAGSEYLMSFNEPDLDQTYIDPVIGAIFYKAELSDKFPNQFLGAPALTNTNETFPWWQTFLANCADCKIDFWPVHWYDIVIHGEYFQQFVNDAVNFANSARPGTKIWLTEIGFNEPASQDDMSSFLEQQLPWLDNHPGVERYSFTAVTADGLDMLYNGMSGPLQKTGQTYVSM